MLVELRAVQVAYGQGARRVCALSALSLAMRNGEFTLVVGPSGSGKSSLLSIIGLMLSPDEGEIRVCGKDVRGLSTRERADLRLRNIGFVFQSTLLLSGLTVLENVMLPMRLAGRSSRTARCRATDLLEQVGVADRRDYKPSRLSGGEGQRVAVCRALANDPALILADEPTASLDSASGTAVTELLADFVQHRGVGVVMVTHDDRVSRFGDRSIRLEDGRVVSDTRTMK